MATWRDAKFSMGGNDTLEDCSVVAVFANWVNLWNTLLGRDNAPVGDTECAAFFRELTGCDQLHPEDNHGVQVQVVLNYMKDHGAFGDPLWQPPAWHEITDKSQIPAALALYRALPCTALLPMRDGVPDFTDAALSLDGSAAHAMLMVACEDGRLALVTWARVEWVSLPWWARFGLQQFGVARPVGVANEVLTTAGKSE